MLIYVSARRVSWLWVVALLLQAPTAFAGNPWEELMGPGKPKLWTDPEGRFYLDLPLGWKAQPRTGTPLVEFWKRHTDYGYVAHVTVEMRSVPPNVNIKHFATRVNEKIRKAARGYRALERRRLEEVSGAAAVRTHFTYQEQGNAELVNEAEQYVFIIGERAFILTFEHAYRVRKVFQEDFDKMVKGFVGHAPGEENLAPTRSRRRIKAGEMINPDAVRY